MRELVGGLILIRLAIYVKLAYDNFKKLLIEVRWWVINTCTSIAVVVEGGALDTREFYSEFTENRSFQQFNGLLDKVLSIQFSQGFKIQSEIQ